MNEEGDLGSALSWFAEALRLEKDPAHAVRHRMRLATTLRQIPKLTHLWLHDAQVNDIQADHTGRLIATASHDQTARIWDTESGRALTPPLAHPYPVREAAFSPDGRGLLTLCGKSFATPGEDWRRRGTRGYGTQPRVNCFLS
ncbi:MAG: hypothetical protein L0Z50_41990 [Verrucomicrobiales bacterium]|nr:hypothetical protein [Verrucomicrobiales bacterium]